MRARVRTWGGHTLYVRANTLKLQPEVKSSRIKSPTDLIAVSIRPNNGKIPKSNAKLGRKFNHRDLREKSY